MADERYQSAYTGTQIDTAIGRIVNKELDKMVANATNAAEAAESALAGVKTAIKNIPSGSTPIVNDLTTGGTTSALSAEQGKVLGQRPNPNLIKNWYFKDPVNQLGETEYAVVGYTLDMWKANLKTLNVALTDDGLTLTNTDTAYNAFFRNYFDTQDCFTGRQMTLSVLLSDGTLFSSTDIINGPATNTTEYNCYTGLDGKSTPEIYAAVAVNASGTTSTCVRIAPGLSVSIAAIKLEYGSIQTLAHQDSDGTWVLNDVWDKTLETLKCQRYRLVVGYSAASGFLTQSQTQLKLAIPTPVAMRTIPTCTEYNITGVRLPQGTNITPTVTSVTVNSATTNALMISAITDTFTDTSTYTNNVPIGCYIQKLVFDAYVY